MKKITTFLLLLLLTAFPSLCLSASLGPYSGKVLDAVTGEPVKGASVLVYWTRRVPRLIGSTSETIDVKLAYTDENGYYHIPGSSENLGLLGELEYTDVVVYQPGYRAYIVKLMHLWHGEKQGPAFVERNNTVRLKRIPPNFDHKKHYSDIEHSLWGIDEYPYSIPRPEDPWIDWKSLIKYNIKGLKKAEFLRRVEWEERRGMQEGR